MSGVSIPAIQTRFKGYLFRSRLEARWAVFFDTLELPWSYEHEGFDLGDTGERFGNGWYLPDFEVGQAFVEIKPYFGLPAGRGNEDRLVSSGMLDAIHALPKLAQMSGRICLLVSGNPWPGEYRLYVFRRDAEVDDDNPVPDSQFADCRKCDGLWTAAEGVGASAIVCECDPARMKMPIQHGPRVMRAFTAARSARFGR